MVDAEAKSVNVMSKLHHVCFWGRVAETPRIHFNLLLTLFLYIFLLYFASGCFCCKWYPGINGKRCISVTWTKTTRDPPPGGGEYIEPMGIREMAPAKGVAGNEESRGQEETRGLC